METTLKTTNTSTTMSVRKYQKNRLVRAVVCTFLMLALSFNTNAGQEAYTVRKNASNITSGLTFFITDGKFGQLDAGTFVDQDSHIELLLGVDERTHYANLSAFTDFTVNLTVTPYDNSNNPLTSSNISLKVSYSPANGGLPYIDLDYYEITTHHKAKVTITSLSGAVPANVYLEAIYKVNRFYHINDSFTPSITANHVTYNTLTGAESIQIPVVGGTIPYVGIETVGEVELAWDYIQGAEEYEIQYTWVDDYDRTASTIPMSMRTFEQNCTRIITKDQRYRIPLVYDRGFLIYRVRAIGRWTQAGPDQNLNRNYYGRWSTYGLNPTKVSNWTSKVQIIKPYEALKNWQYQAVFAELGKKKEIISFFDGSLRNRQTVTRINSNNQAIAGETMYDNQGRSAVQVLPVPISNPSLRYYENLNKNAAGAAYSHNDFDWDNTSLAPCTSSSQIMSNVSGAAKYYSPNNTVRNNWQDYVPVSDGYPFVQVEYTPDNTGRIRRQSGVGQTHAIGSGHETEYFYLQPYQEELNRLFGYEVGYSQRYKKNMVVDANGQVSISYIDPQGRVVATALAGANATGGSTTDPSLLPLASESDPNHGNMSVDLLNKEHIDDEDAPIDNNQIHNTGLGGTNDDALLLNTQINSTSDGNAYSLSYRVRAQSFSDECMPVGKAYPFAYNVSFELQDDCGNNVLVPGALNQYVAGTTNASYTSTANFDQTYSFNATLNTASYSLTKMIRINHDTLNKYLADYLATSTCLYDAEDYNIASEIDCGDPITIDPITVCSVTEQMMLADVSPGGQYGDYDGGAGMTTSVFSTSNALTNDASLCTTCNWQNSTLDYYEADGTTLSQIMYGGVLTDPEDLPLDVFIASWKPSWAKTLIIFHPEYCYKDFFDPICEHTETVNGTAYSSESFDAALLNLDTYAEASNTTTNPFNLNITIASGTWNIQSIDPYFDYAYPTIEGLTTLTPSENTVKSNLMNAMLTNYKAMGISMFDFCIKTVMCGTDLAGTCTIPAIGTLTTAQKDQVWATFRSTYISEKKKINQFFADMYAIKGDCHNGYIGDSELDFSLVSFIHYPTYLTQLLGIYGFVMTDTGYPSLVPPWFFSGTGSATPYASLFEDKLQRFIPISNLYDAGISETAAVSEMVAEADAVMYNETGACPIVSDMQHFLDALAKGDYFDNTNIAANSIPQFTADLYTSMGGTIVTSGGTAVVINNAINGTGKLEISATNALGGGSLGADITLDPPAGLTWANYMTTWQIESMSMLYYVPGSTNYGFKILAEINQGGTITEVVMTGTTNVPIGLCTYPTPCERENALEENLVNLFAWLEGGNHLANTTTNVALSTNVGWYDNSELQMQLLDFGSTAVYDGVSAGVFDIKTNDYKITVNFGASYPANMDIITGGTLDGTTLTIWYINTSGALVSATATITRYDLLPSQTTIALDLNCECEAEADLEAHIQTLVNSILLAYNGGSLATPTGGPVTWPEVSAMDPYTSISYPDLHNFAYQVQNPTALVFSFDKDNNCKFIFGDGSNGVISGLVEVYNVQITYDASGNVTQITCVGLKSNGTTVNLQTTNTNPGCLSFEPCDGCLPQPIAPVSCTSAYTAYNNAITSLNNAILTSTSPALDPEDAALFPTFTQAEFCDLNLAYITTAYLHYISSAVMNVTNQDSPYYLSIQEFGNTQLNYGYENGTTDLVDVVDLYETYEDSHLEFSWIQYVNTIYMTDEICPPNPLPMAIPNITVTYPCEQLTQNADAANSSSQYDIYLQNTAENFKQRYIEEAISSLIENVDMTYPDKEFHYTLYYYDQAGNLVQTVPPAGVDRIETSEINEPLLNSTRNTNPASPPTTTNVLPAHTYATNYRYNSLNQLTRQTTPDGGTSFFAYDKLGRLVVSQNALQLANNQMSYTKYDDLGRIVEVGEMNVAASTYTFNANGNLVLVAGGGLVDVSAANFPDNISSSQEEVVVTIYDEATTTIQNLFLPNVYSANNTRNRIVGVLYFNTVTSSTNMAVDYANASFYDYDVHGNVKEVVQQNKNADLLALTTSDQTVKKTEYEYELVSGNVKKVTYQKGKTDQFAHQYKYDADNRITRVLTSANTRIWEQDAKYFYYDHGPLARIEYGDKKVQGTDFAYTLQGWVKGVNGEDLDRKNDVGDDGQKLATNRMSGRDAMAYSLNYFPNDYNGRFNNDNLKYSKSATPTPNNYHLYNGNIKEMYTNISDETQAILGASHTSYRYDQLNRIRSMNQELITTNGSGVITQTTGFYESNYTYDANGNLLTHNTWAKNGTLKTQMDQLTYTYQTVGGNPSNQLDHVDDVVAIGTFSVDVDDQNTDNYVYDNIGQLTKDVAEDIEQIKWTVTGKVKEIIFNNALNTNKSTTTDRIIFEYDAMGNRISKKVIPLTGTPEITYYTYDAQGNVMSVYTYKTETSQKNFYLSERNMYGSSRIGLESVGQVVASTTPANVNISTAVKRKVGDKRFELSNHLGNVLNVITDRKLPVTESVGFQCYNGTNQAAQSVNTVNASTASLANTLTMEAWVKSTSTTGTHAIVSYYQESTVNRGAILRLNNGKLEMIGRQGTSTTYTSGVGSTLVADGKWHHVVGTFDNGIYKVYVDGVLESTTSVPVIGNFSGLNYKFNVGRVNATGTTYSQWANACIKEVSIWSGAKTASDIENNYEDYIGYTGSETNLKGYWKVNDGTGSTYDDLTTSNNNLITTNTTSSTPVVFTWSSDVMVDYFTADVESYSDYYPFGMQLPGRNGGSDYRFGFQNQEEDDEIKGDGNSINYTYRMHDPRIGRFFAVDPIAGRYAYNSPYAFSENRVIDGLELEGLEVATLNATGKPNELFRVTYVGLHGSTGGYIEPGKTLDQAIANSDWRYSKENLGSKYLRGLHAALRRADAYNLQSNNDQMVVVLVGCFLGKEYVDIYGQVQPSVAQDLSANIDGKGKGGVVFAPDGFILHATDKNLPEANKHSDCTSSNGCGYDPQNSETVVASRWLVYKDGVLVGSVANNFQFSVDWSIDKLSSADRITYTVNNSEGISWVSGFGPSSTESGTLQKGATFQLTGNVQNGLMEFYTPDGTKGWLTTENTNNENYTNAYSVEAPATTSAGN